MRMRSIKNPIVIVLLATALGLAAEDKPLVPQTPHELTSAERALIWRRLFEQAQAIAAKQSADVALQQALNACGEGQQAATDSKSGELICVMIAKKTDPK